MDLSAINPVLLLASIMVSSTPILLAALGELVVERAGVLNLGVEGMMVTGAVVGFVITWHLARWDCSLGGLTCGVLKSPYFGFLPAALAGAALALFFGFLTQFLLSNQTATGLALTLFGLGLAALIGRPYRGETVPIAADVPVPLLSEIPFIGPILFQHDLIVYLSVLLVAGIWWFLTRSRAGLILRAVGENHDAAHALGYKVVRIRLLAILFGGAMAGLGGAYLSLIRVPTYTEGVTAGAGWIALAIVVFGSWRAWRLMIGAYLFGGIGVLQLNLQAAGARIPVEILTMSPYVITIIALVVLSSGRAAASSRAPGSLGQVFHAAH